MHHDSLVVLDSSALLAYARGEPRADLVGQSLVSLAISATNVAEVVAVLSRYASATAAARCVARLGLAVVSCDWTIAVAAGEIHEATRSHGLSLAECVCLATAQRLGVPAVTANEAWAGCDVGVEIRVL